MTADLWSMWNSAARLGLPAPTAAEISLLILLGALLLALRTFRENYLKIWVVAWLSLSASRLAEHFLPGRIAAPFDLVVVHATFVVAAGLLAGGALLYIRERDLLLPVMVITPVLVGFAGARVLLWPDSLPLRMALEVGYRMVLLTASVALLRARRGRWHLSAWLVAVCLPCLHLSWPSFSDRVPVGAYLAAEIALGICILLIVFDDARTKAHRLGVMQRITESVSKAQQYGNVVQCALEELKALTGVRGVWFRLFEGGGSGGNPRLRTLFGFSARCWIRTCQRGHRQAVGAALSPYQQT